MFKNRSYLAVPAIILSTIGLAAAQDFILTEATDPFAVSFRGAAQTTYFGWIDGTFDGATDDEIIDNPTTTIGTEVPDISLTQLTSGDILASSNNIYNGVGPNSNPGVLSLIIPTAGTVDSGFTTIIIQGRAVGGGMPGLTTVPSFGTIEGLTPQFVWGGNLNGKTQFWAKYEIPGNKTLYRLQIGLIGGTGVFPTSIANLQVDTLWSETDFAPDAAFAVAPEPEPPAANPVAPIVSVQGKARRSTRSSRTTIQGVATGDAAISGVYYTVGRKPIRKAVGGENWSFRTPLEKGKNVVRIFVVDANGNLTTTRRMVVTRR